MKTACGTWWIVLVLLLDYQCQADVRMPPLITSAPSNEVIYKIGSPVTLPCSATGIPEPSYKWWKDDAELEMNDRITLDPSAGDGTIIIKQANKILDNGMYQCVATNQHGEALSAEIKLQQAELVFNSPTTAIDVNLEEGEQLKLVLHDTLTFAGVVKYAWKTVQKGSNIGTNLITNTRIAVDQATGSLYFANVLTTDDVSGRNDIYKMDVTNIFEDATIGGAPYNVLITPNSSPAPRPPGRMVPEVEDYTHIALKGQDTVIKCFFEGFPTPTITWRHPTGGPPPSRIDCTKESNTECWIRAVQYSDEGIYTCSGRNSQGSQEVEINLVVKSVPTFEAAPSSGNVTVGSSRSFLCRADAVPPATITWYSNGKEITREDPGNNRIVISEDLTNLTVIDVCKDCEGDPPSDLQVFQCKISNIHGDIFGSAYLNVLEPTVIYDKGEFQNIIVNPETEPVEARFVCRATTDALVQDDLSVAWFFLGQQLYNEPPYQIENNGENLHIDLDDLPKSEWDNYLGVYTCRAYAPYDGDMDVALYSFSILPDECIPPQYHKPPVMTTSAPREIFFDEGDRIVLPCSASGNPAPIYQWTFNGDPIQLDNRFVQPDPEDGLIYIVSARQDTDSGLYQCKAINEYGEDISRPVIIRDADGPKFLVTPKSQNVTIGGTISFDCVPKGPAEVDWFSNGVKIDSAYSGRYVISKDKGILMITEVCRICGEDHRTDTQVIQCRISDEYGRSYASAYLNVY